MQRNYQFLLLFMKQNSPYFTFLAGSLQQSMDCYWWKDQIGYQLSRGKCKWTILKWTFTILKVTNYEIITPF